MAHRIDGEGPDARDSFNESFERLEQTAGAEAPRAELRTFLTLARNIENVTGKT